MQSHDDEELGDEHGAGASTSEAATEVSLFLSLSQRDQGDRRTGMPLRTLKKYSILNAPLILPIDTEGVMKKSSLGNSCFYIPRRGKFNVFIGFAHFSA